MQSSNSGNVSTNSFPLTQICSPILSLLEPFIWPVQKLLRVIYLFTYNHVQLQLVCFTKSFVNKPRFLVNVTD